MRIQNNDMPSPPVRNVFDFSSVSELLNYEFTKRKARNARYSLRAFARDIGISVSRTSEVLSQSSDPSPNATISILNHLGYAGEVRNYFFNLATLSSQQSQAVKESARQRLAEIRKSRLFSKIRPNSAGLSEWYLLPMLELLSIGKTVTAAELATRFNVPQAKIELALQKFRKEGRIHRDSEGAWKKIDQFSRIESAIPMEEIRGFHVAYCELAKNAIRCHPISERKSLTAVLSIQTSEIQAARAELENFLSGFVRRYGARTPADDVFALSIQFFRPQG